MTTFFGVLFCLSPLIFLCVGYYVGRYGLPFEIRRRSMVDRRTLDRLEQLGEEPIRVYKGDVIEA